MRTPPITVSTVLALCGAANASGTDSDAPLRPRNDWTIRFEPMIWAPALRGDIEAPGGPSVDLETLDADEVEIAPSGRFTLRGGRWSFVFRGFAFSTDQPAADIDLAGFDLTAGYRAWTPIDDHANEVRLSFDLVAGARAHSLDFTVAGSAADHTWFEPIGGVRGALDLPHGFGLDLSLDAGGFASGEDSSFSWDITVAFSWMMLDNVGLEIGFRHLQMDLTEGDEPARANLDASLAGLFGAIVIRF